MEKENEFITVKQASELLQVTTRTIYNWIWSHKINVINTPSGRIRISKNDLFEIKDK